VAFGASVPTILGTADLGAGLGLEQRTRIHGSTHADSAIGACAFAPVVLPRRLTHNLCLEQEFTLRNSGTGTRTVRLRYQLDHGHTTGTGLDDGPLMRRVNPNATASSIAAAFTPPMFEQAILEANDHPPSVSGANLPAELFHAVPGPRSRRHW